MGLLIRHGEIVTADSRYKAEIYIADQTITRIGTDLSVPPETEIIDATGKLIFPGFIDPHVHIYLPFMATFAKDTHETASVAALIGGTTTFIEMCCPSRTEDALAGYSLWKEKAAGKSACDYAFHMTVSRFDQNTETQLREIVHDGTTSFKIFLSYKNFFGVDDSEMFQTLSLAKELGVIVTAHCENAELVTVCNKPCSRRVKRALNGMSPVVRSLSRQKAQAASLPFLKTREPSVTWCTSLVLPVLRRRSRRSLGE